mgnify:CR=1 FL=1
MFSLAVVMLGHWLMAGIEFRDGRLVRYKDYGDGHEHKLLTLSAEEFLRGLSKHASDARTLNDLRIQWPARLRHATGPPGTEKWNQTINPVAVRNGTFSVLLNTNTNTSATVE